MRADDIDRLKLHKCQCRLSTYLTLGANWVPFCMIQSWNELVTG